MKSEYFFFGQNMDSDSDTTSTSVFVASRKACFKSFVNANLLGVAQVVNIHTATAVSTTIPSVSAAPTMTIGHTWSFMHSMTLSATGSVYLILDVHPSSTPSPLQVLSSLNSLGNQALVGAGLRYDSTGLPVNFTFTPITPSQAYDIYYIVANDSPFIDQLSFSAVQSITFTAEATPASVGSRVVSNVMSVLVGIAIMLIL